MRNIEGVIKIDKPVGDFSVWGEDANKMAEISDTESLADSTAYHLLENAVQSIASTSHPVR